MLKHVHKRPVQRAMIHVALVMIVLCCGVFSLPAFAQDIPSCALTGSMTMMIGGKPALRLSDVANCPPDLYEIISSVQLDGQPMVHFKGGITGKMRCFTTGNPTVQIEDNKVSTLGEVACAATR